MEKVLNFFVLLVLPFLFLGMINRVKAFWAGRKGASIFQPFYDFTRLLKKGEVISTTTSFVFQIAPTVTFASILFAGFLAPMAGHKALFAFQGDFILFAYILGLGRFFSIIGAMDTGSSFEGMGASREGTFGALVEPAFFIVIASLSALSGAASFETVLRFPQSANGLMILILFLVIVILFIMILTEGCRVPVDDPNTHLELTMIHEVMILDNSGPNLALIHYGAGMKMVVLTSLLCAMVIPEPPGFLYSALIFIGIQALTAIIIGCVESLMARLKMTHVPHFILLMTSLSLIVLCAVVFFNYGGLQ
jgi:formate hydrogenlyase subunit 4